MALHKTLHPRDDVDRQYVSRKEAGRGLAIIQHSVNASIQRLEDLEEYQVTFVTNPGCIFILRILVSRFQFHFL